MAEVVAPVDRAGVVAPMDTAEVVARMDTDGVVITQLSSTLAYPFRIHHCLQHASILAQHHTRVSVVGVLKYCLRRHTKR